MRLLGHLLAKTAAAKMKVVSCVAVIKDGKILMGKRRDNQKWTFPGGHCEPGESPLEGALRELEEESGIQCDPHQLKHLDSDIVDIGGGKKLHVHAYRATLKPDTPTTMKNDPDGEVYRWHWISPNGGIRAEIWDNLHVPPERNVVTKALGLTGVGQDKQASRRRIAKQMFDQAAQEYLSRNYEDDNYFRKFRHFPLGK